MKSRKGSICAIGFMLPRQQVIHGHPVRKGNIVVSIEDVTQVGAKTVVYIQTSLERMISTREL